jgi:Periplasmic protein involved in polysaccharide export
MGWRSYLISLAFLVACAMGALAQDARTITPVSLTPMVVAQAQYSAQNQQVFRPSEGAPRYSAQIPPSREDTPPLPGSAESAAPPAGTYSAGTYSVQQGPSAAPVTPVSVNQVPRYAQPASQQPVSQPAPQAAPQAGPQPLSQPVLRQTRDPDERITVSALRQSQDGLYRLGPGDKLHITVFNETDLSGDFVIDGQGFVRLPLLGQLQAAGLTSFSLESRISEALAGGGYLVNPRVSVDITTYRPFYILGEVAKPGEYAYVNAMTVPNAIALAGGYTDRAVTSAIYIRHQGQTEEHELAADESTRVLPGDIVRVRRTVYWTIMTWLSPIFSPFATAAYILK